MYLLPSLAYTYGLARDGGLSWHDKGLLLCAGQSIGFCFAFMLVIIANMRVGAALKMAISLRDQPCLPSGLGSKDMYLLPSLAYTYALTRYGGVACHGFSQYLMLWQKMTRGCSYGCIKPKLCFAIMLVFSANIRVGAALQMALGLRGQACLPLGLGNLVLCL